MRRSLLFATSIAAFAALSAPAFAESPDSRRIGFNRADANQPGRAAVQCRKQDRYDHDGQHDRGSIETLMPVMAAGTTTAGQIQTLTQV